jgi:hypothetical protein
MGRMNERIRLLAEQAKKYALDAMIKITDKEQALKVYSETYDTKFAELILIEVTDILSTYRGKVVFTDGAEYNYEHPIIAIRKHFGVKE